MGKLQQGQQVYGVLWGRLAPEMVVYQASARRACTGFTKTGTARGRVCGMRLWSAGCAARLLYRSQTGEDARGGRCTPLTLALFSNRIELYVFSSNLTIEDVTIELFYLKMFFHHWGRIR